MSSSQPKRIAKSWIYSSTVRAIVCFALGLVVGFGVFMLGLGLKSILVGWDTAIFLYVIWVVVSILRLKDGDTAALASREDPGQISADVLLILASVASLVAVGGVLTQVSSSEGAAKWYLVVLSIVSVALSWALVHTVFTLRYARLYYAAPKGGISFHDDSDPSYREFAYLAFTVGMTYQVSDTDISEKEIRGLVLRHAILSYLFGTVIVAVTINLVVGLSK